MATEKKNVRGILSKVKKNKSETPKPVIQKVVAPKKRRSSKKEGVEYVKGTLYLNEDLHLELNTLKVLTKKTQIEIIEEALERYLPVLREELESKKKS